MELSIDEIYSIMNTMDMQYSGIMALTRSIVEVTSNYAVAIKIDRELSDIIRITEKGRADFYPFYLKALEKARENDLHNP